MTNVNKFKVLLMVTALIMIPIILVDVLAMRIALGCVILGHYIYFIYKVKSVSKKQLLAMLKDIDRNENDSFDKGLNQEVKKDELQKANNETEKIELKSNL